MGSLLQEAGGLQEEDLGLTPECETCTPTNGCHAIRPVLQHRYGQGGVGPPRREHLTLPGGATEGIKQRGTAELGLSD